MPGMDHVMDPEYAKQGGMSPLLSSCSCCTDLYFCCKLNKALELEA